MSSVSMTGLSMGVLLGLAMLGSAGPAQSAGGGGGGGGGFSGGSGSGPDANEAFREGTALLAEGDCAKAEKKFRVVTKAAPRSAEANYLRGAALQCLGKHKKAIRYLKKAIRYNERIYTAYERLGVSYLALDKAEDAQSELDKLAGLEAECAGDCPEKLVDARRRLSKVLAGDAPTEGAGERGAEEGDGGRSSSVDDAAIDGSQHGLLFEPVAQPQATYLAAIEQINRAEFQQAIDELERLTGAIGPHPDVLNYLGYANRRLGRFGLARAYYEQALTLDPDHRGANEYLGEMWVELDRIDLARERLEVLRRVCAFGCAEFEDLERIIESHFVASR